MGRKRLTKLVLASFAACSLIAISWSSAFATAALAATPANFSQQITWFKSTSDGLVTVDLGARAYQGVQGNPRYLPSSSPIVRPAPSSNPAWQPAPKPYPNPVATSGLTNEEQKALNLLNSDRAANGLPALRVNLRLVNLAESYAQDMINRNYFSHTNPEGLSPFDRMSRASIQYGYAGENLAINSAIDTAERAFMNSPGHRANILNGHYTQVGVGVRHAANGSVYVVQEFTDG